MPKISVIVPFRNASAYLPRCLASLQQEGDFEVVLVNDRSTDDWKCVTDSFGFHVENNMSVPGVSGARNWGLYKATGEWVTFLDADDKWLKGAYRTFCGAIDDEHNIVQFNHSRTYRDGTTAFKHANKGGVYSLDSLPRMWSGVWNKLYRADFLKRNMIRFDADLRNGEDWIFNLDCLMHDDRIKHAPYREVVLMRCFDNPTSLSRTVDWFDVSKTLGAFMSTLNRAPNDKRGAVYNVMLDYMQADNIKGAVRG